MGKSLISSLIFITLVSLSLISDAAVLMEKESCGNDPPCKANSCCQYSALIASKCVNNPATACSKTCLCQSGYVCVGIECKDLTLTPKLESQLLVAGANVTTNI